MIRWYNNNVNKKRKEGIKMKNKNVVKFKNWKGLIKVVSINEEKVQSVLYFDKESFEENIVDLVELYTGSRNYKLKKVLF